MENQETTTPQSEAQTALAPNPFDDSAWVEQTPTTTDVPQETQQEQSSPTEEQKQSEEEIFDADEYLKTQLGYDNWEAAKNELAELKKLRESATTKEEIKFANDESKKFFDYFKEGKKTDLFNYLQEQFRLENILSKQELTSNDAAELIKLSMQVKNKELSPDDVEFLFSQEYSMPSKPVQNDLQTDEEYQAQVAQWQAQVDAITKKMVINAKLAKPDLAKYKQDLVLPDINKPEQQQQGLNQEELDKIKTAYRNSIEPALQKFNGYSVTAQALNGEVKIPVSYAITNEEKAAQKAALEGFDMDNYFAARWLNEDGSHNTAQLADDKYLLENKEKIFQKFANEVAAQTIKWMQQNKTNTNLNGKTGAGTFNPDAKTYQQKMVDAIWDA